MEDWYVRTNSGDEEQTCLKGKEHMADSRQAVRKEQRIQEEAIRNGNGSRVEGHMTSIIMELKRDAEEKKQKRE